MRTEKRSVFKTAIYFAILFFLINPVTLFLITDSLLATFGIFFVAFTVTTFVVFGLRSRRLILYYYNLLFLLSICYHSELIFRVNYKEFNIPNLYKIEGRYYFNKGNLTQVLDDGEYITDYVTNKQGYRISVSLDPSQEIKECDWLFLGDSYTQGAQVNYEDLFTTKLYNSFPDKIILNAGISGYSIIDSYQYYKDEGHKLNAKKVFLQLCNFNDFMNISSAHIGWSEYLMESSDLYRFFIYNAKYTTPSSLPLGRFTEPFYKSEEDNLKYNIFYKESSKEKEEDLLNLSRYLKKFEEVVTQNGAELIVILIPTKEQINYEAFEQVVSSFELDVTKLDMKKPNDLMTTLALEHQFELIDVTDSFLETQQKLFFKQDEHLNALGHQMLAEVIVDELNDTQNRYKYLSQNNNENRYPSYSESDSLVLYQGLLSGYFQIFTNNLDFNKESILVSNNTHKIHPTISKNQRYLAYTIGDQDKMRTHVIVEDLELGLQISLSNGVDNFSAIPSFSNDSKMVVFPSWRIYDGKLTNPVITTFNLQNNEFNYLTEDFDESWRPIFTPNDSIVYFITKSINNSNYRIKSVNIHSHETKEVLSEDFNIWDPCISADGRKLVFAGNIAGNWDLFEYDLEQDVSVRLTNTKGDEWDPCFSRIENKLIFAGNFGLNNGIYTLELDSQ